MNKKIGPFIALGSFVLLIFISLSWLKTQGGKGELIIGILQTVSHPALDAAREGFKEELSRLLHNKVSYIEHNAQGNPTQAQSIATSLHSNPKVSGIYAIASLAAQAAARVEKKKPIFIAAVTDPQGLGLIYPATNVCGSSDKADTSFHVKLVRILLPHIRRLSILFNPAEAGSFALVKEMTAALDASGIEHHDVGVHSASEVSSAALIAAKNADAIWIPTDNLIASSMSLVARIATKAGVPVIASDVELVAQGALIGQGVDYRDSGRQTARIAQKVLIENHPPHTLELVYPKKTSIKVNLPLALQLNIPIPEAIKNGVL